MPRFLSLTLNPYEKCLAICKDGSEHNSWNIPYVIESFYRLILLEIDVWLSIGVLCKKQAPNQIVLPCMFCTVHIKL